MATVQTRTAKAKPTPMAAARMLRIIFASALPKHPCDRDILSAYEFALMVREQAGCPFDEAAEAVREAIPECFADHWVEWIAKNEVAEGPDGQ